jgi:anti-sigma-K factor RskA
LKLELMRMDLSLKTKQAFWETPRNIAILPATVAAVAGALGYKFGQSPQPAPIIINVPAPAASK